jgi:hypothetical protein
MDEVEIEFEIQDEVERESTTVLSVDIGMTNLALYKECVDLKKISKVKRVPMTKRYTKNGEATPEQQAQLDEMFLCGSVKWIDKVNITREDDKFVGKKVKRRVVTSRMLLRLSDYLDEQRKKGVFDDVDTIIIEQQLKTNPNAQIIQYHIRSYFLFQFRDTKTIYSFQSRYKTQILGAPKKLPYKKKVAKKDVVEGAEEVPEVLRKMTKAQRKGWAETKALKILSSRDDMKTVNFIFNENKSKADDLSDVICQLQAFIYLKHVLKCFEE